MGTVEELTNVAEVLGVEPDTWLSSVMDRLALRVVRAHSGVEPSLEESERKGVFATAKVPTSDVRLSRDLQALGFVVIDTALTFECAEPVAASRSTARRATPEDQQVVGEIAQSAFVFSRFHLDPNIPDGLANRIKREWVENFFSGRRGHEMVVAELDGSVGGFLLLVDGGKGERIIDLIAVAPEFARQGLGQDMIAFTGKSARESGSMPSKWVVGTQAANIPSVRLYESVGFRLASSQFVLHYHGRGLDELSSLARLKA